MIQELKKFTSWTGTEWAQSPFEWKYDLEECKNKMIEIANSTAYDILTKTDWMIVRQYERNILVSQNILDFRNNIRESCGIKVNNINSCTTKQDLSDYCNSIEFLTWEPLSEPSQDP